MAILNDKLDHPALPEKPVPITYRENPRTEPGQDSAGSFEDLLIKSTWHDFGTGGRSSRSTVKPPPGDASPSTN